MNLFHELDTNQQIVFQGKGAKIGPNVVLIFDVELISIN